MPEETTRKLKIVYPWHKIEKLGREACIERLLFLLEAFRHSSISKIICMYYLLKIYYKQNKSDSKKIIPSYLISKSYQTPRLEN